MESDERKHEVIALEWTSLRVLWGRCRKRACATERKEIDDLFPEGYRDFSQCDAVSPEGGGTAPTPDGVSPKTGDASSKDDGTAPRGGDAQSKASGAAPKHVAIGDGWTRLNYAEQRVGMLLDGSQLHAEYLSQLELARSRKLRSLRLHECNKKKLFEKVDDEPTPAQREAYRALLYDLQSWFADRSYHRRLRKDMAVQLILFGSAALVLAFNQLAWLWLCPPSGTVGWEAHLLDHQPARLLLTIAGFGVLGAYFSRVTAFQTRLATLEFDEVMNVYRRPMMIVRLMIGLIAALLLYWFLRAGLIGGSAFPRIGPLSQQGAKAAADSSEPATELAKLVAWSFVAGFSERLIPDALGRAEGAR